MCVSILLFYNTLQQQENWKVWRDLLLETSPVPLSSFCTLKNKFTGITSCSQLLCCCSLLRTFKGEYCRNIYFRAVLRASSVQAYSVLVSTEGKDE